MRVCEVPFGTLGFDTDARLTPASLAAILAARPDLKFAIRYLPELTAEEISAIFAAGLGLMLVAHVRYAGWQPSKALGAGDAERVCRRAQALSIPPNATIWCDLECMAGTGNDVVDYEHAWAAMCKSFHYEPGDYIGAGVPLSASELYKRLQASRYWKSESDVLTPSPRGFQMIQLTPPQSDLLAGGTLIGGVGVDLDITQFDHKGTPPTWIVAA